MSHGKVKGVTDHEQINEPENQGVPLEMRDYALLCLVTVVIPAVLITLGMVLS